MPKLTFNEFGNFFKYYKSESQQEAGIHILYDQMRDVLKDDAHDWITTYRKKPEVTSTGNPLTVPYQSQNDNASGTGYRECFSSSCAMVAMYYGKIENDDAYNLVRQKYGDSTDAQAQVRTLRSLGLEANFISNGTTADIRACIDAGRPVPVGWLHHGSASAPSGGGHYSVVVGYTDKAWIVNDPNGEANLSAGGYTSNTDGSNQSYSFKNFNPRWIVEGEGSGWMMDIRNTGAKK
jgi:hypothetical protein